MTARAAELALDAIVQARGFIAAQLRHRGPLPESLRALVRDLDRAHGALLRPSSLHSPGAYARCACGRYSASARVCSLVADPSPHRRPVTCDCGRSDGWSVAFPPP